MGDSFVTGEAVALDLTPARVPSRCYAALVDLCVAIPVFFVLDVVAMLLLPVFLPTVTIDLRVSVTILAALAALVGYPVVCEALTGGLTVGKLLLGLRVVRSDGGPVTFRHTLSRGLAAGTIDLWVFGLFGFVATVVSTGSTHARRIGDVLAGTVVVHRTPHLGFRVFPAPTAPARAWARGVSLADIPDSLAYLAREFLVRRPQLRLDAAHHLETALAHRVCAALGVPLPPLHPHDLLAATVIERGERSWITPTVTLAWPR